MQIIIIAIAGAFGALSRHGLNIFITGISGGKFAFGTLTVNVLGCFLIGFVMHIAQTTDIIRADIRIAVTTGFLGAFTTFSTFSLETYRYIEESQWLLAGSNVALNVLLGLIATVIGMSAARLILGG